MNDINSIKHIEKLVEAFLLLDNVKDMKAFLRDLCTMKEIKSMSERFEVMKMVNEGTPYREISKQTKVSTATITRVAHWLKHGADGYKIVLKKLKIDN